MKLALSLVLFAVGALSVTPVSLLAQAPATAAATHPVDASVVKELEGRWHNDFLPEEQASTLYIQKIEPETGLITGTYTSPIGAGFKEFPLIGWVNTKLPPPLKEGEENDHVIVVSFSVRWNEYGTVTAWNGYYTPTKGAAGALIVGQWLRSQPNSEFHWGHITTGQDRYHKLAEK